jgi:hypothetical protein
MKKKDVSIYDTMEMLFDFALSHTQANIPEHYQVV